MPKSSRAPRRAEDGHAEISVSAWVTIPACLGIFVLLGGCVARAPIGPVEIQRRPISIEETLSQPQAGCLEWRWIGVKEEGELACPVTSGLRSRGMFERRRNGRFAPPQATRLRSYCVYEGDTPNDTTARGRVLAAGKFTQVDRDCVALAGSAAPELSTLEWQTLGTRFGQQVGRAEGIVPRAGAATTSSPARPVRLSVLDTSPTTTVNPEQARANSVHGFTLLNLAKSLVCPGANAHCVAALTSQLALAYTKIDTRRPSESVRDTTLGGYVGSIGDLAEAIHEEVDSWLSEPVQTRAPHLVLNLSVGWSPRFGGLPTGNNPASERLPGPVRAVYDALTFASCHGALVVTAAGNLLGGALSESGPLLPGAWEVWPAPDARTCRQLLGSNVDSSIFPGPAAAGSASRKGVYRPLIYSVAGVQADNQPLANARSRSLGRLAAFGDHAVAKSPIADAPTATLTGSSVSALVASATAATVWYFRPGLRSDEVMDLVYRGGEDLRLPVDYCVGGSAANPCPLSTPTAPLTVRRLSQCGSLAAACGAGVEDLCPQVTIACPQWSTSPPDLSSAVDLTPFADTSNAKQLDATELRVATAQQPACGDVPVWHSEKAGPPPQPCPHLQQEGLCAAPWVNPQPGETPCPNCTLFQSTRTLIIQIASTFSGTLTNATLRLGTSLYSLGLPPLRAGSVVRLYNINNAAGYSSGVVSFTVNGTHSALSTVLVVK